MGGHVGFGTDADDAGLKGEWDGSKGEERFRTAG